MVKKTARFNLRFDAELLEHLRQRSIVTGASVAELIRRAVNLARYQEQRPRVETRRSK